MGLGLDLSRKSGNMQQNHNHAKLLHEFQFHTQPKIRRKSAGNKSAANLTHNRLAEYAPKNFIGRPNGHKKFGWRAKYKSLLTQIQQEYNTHYSCTILPISSILAARSRILKSNAGR